eukprot:Hpha_TRINITY_DN29356_c0_g1::TRINITY_DN29356_c0_g1_i1::g.112415::m.112415
MLRLTNACFRKQSAMGKGRGLMKKGERDLVDSMKGRNYKGGKDAMLQHVPVTSGVGLMNIVSPRDDLRAYGGGRHHPWSNPEKEAKEWQDDHKQVMWGFRHRGEKAPTASIEPLKPSSGQGEWLPREFLPDAPQHPTLPT